MANETLFVLSEVFDFAIDHSIHIGLGVVWLLSVYVGLDVCQKYYTRREQKLDEDRARVRELQQQLGVLRTVRSKREAEKKKKEKNESPETSKAEGEKATKAADPPPVKRKIIDISMLTKAPPLSPDRTDVTAADLSTGTAETDGSSVAHSKDDAEHGENDNLSSSKKIEAPVTQGTASNAYESVKDAWTWGRHETPFAPLLGVAEGLTAKAVGLFGTDMKGLDDALKPHVSDLDEHVLQPTLSNVSSFFYCDGDKNCEEEDDKDDKPNSD